MSNSAETAKINKFIHYAKRKWKTEDRDDLVSKLKVGRIRKRVQRYTRKGSKGGRRIYSKEVVDIWKNGILKEGEGKISKKDLNDFGYLIGSKFLTLKGKQYLVRNVVRRLGLSKNASQQQGAKKGDKQRNAVVSTLRRFAGRGFTGFAIRHGGSKFVYKPQHYLKIAELVQAGSIDVVYYSANDGKNGSFSPNNNLIRVRDGRSGLAEASTLIHEATHAIQDLNNLAGTIGEWETAAHVAQGMTLAYAKGINALGDYDKPNKKTGSEKRLGSVSFVAMIQEIVSTGKLTDVPSIILDDARKILAKHGYKDKVHKKVNQNVFDKNNFVDLWLNL